MTAADFETTLSTVTRLVKARATRYYPCLADQPVEVRVANARMRQFTRLCELQLSSGDWSKMLLTKIKRIDETERKGQELSPGESYVVPRPDRQGAEYEAMVRIEKHFDELADERFFTVPVLDSLIEDRVLVMEKVSAQSLSGMLRGCANPVLAGRTRDQILDAVARTGIWLRRYHQMPCEAERRERGSRGSDFLNWIQVVGSFLSHQTQARRFFERIEIRMRQAAGEFLPEQLPCSVLHDDFAPRNVLIDGQGRIGAIDTLMEWHGCVWEDIAQFVVSIHTNKLRTLSCGLLFSPRLLREIEERFVGAYFGAEPIPWSAIRLYQAQTAMTKWAAMVRNHQEHRRWQSASRLAISSRQFATYVEDCLSQMDHAAVDHSMSRYPSPGAAGGGR